MNPLVKIGNGVLDGMAAGLKAFTMTFSRGASFILMPRTRYDYAGDVRQGLENSIVLAVVSWAIRNIPQVPIGLRAVTVSAGKVKKDPVLPGDTGPGAMLSLLLYPNTFYTGLLLMQAVLIDRITRANAYVAKVRNDSGRVVQLWWLPEHLVEPKWPDDGSAYISHYEYNPNGTPYRLDPDDVIHFRDGLDPQNPRKGLNKLAALFREIWTDDEAANFSASLLKNFGVPGVIIAPESTGVAAQNRLADPEGIKTKFKETFQGDNRGDVMVLTAPTKVQVLSFNPQQMALKDLRRLPEERVTAVFGLAAVVAGLGAGLDRSTYSNMEEARAAAFEEFAIPTLEAICSDLRFQLLNEFADPFGHEVFPDTSEVRVLQEDQNNLWKRWLEALQKGGVTRAKFKEAIGEEFDDSDQVYYVPAALEIVNAKEPPPPLASEQAQATEGSAGPAGVDPLRLPQSVPAVSGGNGNGAASAARP